MINILLAIRLFKSVWSGLRILIKCDNVAVVSVLRSGKTKEPFWGAVARNIWFESDIDLQYVHITGKCNKTADLLSRWTGSNSDCSQLMQLVQDPQWLVTHINMLEIDNSL